MVGCNRRHGRLWLNGWRRSRTRGRRRRGSKSQSCAYSTTRWPDLMPLGHGSTPGRRRGRGWPVRTRRRGVGGARSSRWSSSSPNSTSGSLCTPASSVTRPRPLHGEPERHGVPASLQGPHAATAVRESVGGRRWHTSATCTGSVSASATTTARSTLRGEDRRRLHRGATHEAREPAESDATCSTLDRADATGQASATPGAGAGTDRWSRVHDNRSMVEARTTPEPPWHVHASASHH